MSGIQFAVACEKPKALERFASSSAVLSILIVGQVCFASQALAAERSLNVRVIESGHSLTDPIPPMLTRMVEAAGGSSVVVAQSTTPGSPMEWRWEHSTQAPDARIDIADYEILVTTERVPLSNTMPWHDSEKAALRWFVHAWTNGNGGRGAETVLYATWVGIDSGPEAQNPYNDPEAHIPWPERLPLEIDRWEKIADYVNANRPAGSAPMRIIPGPQIMAAIHDALADGSAPGLTNISDLFSDNIHINDLGAYAISLAHFAVVYGRDPRDLPANLGQPEPPSQALADWLQELVWTTVTSYERSGVTGAR
ncbi:hypothetical protein LHFGNBLO_001694 [Mesorhizobium sp. AR10]|uniref:hypothetical protein n=1 Tax=Mesorhizobium sp. AR10 TaxID=2865839 RepID=UPI00215E2459|nr:hypothetical protein [Mesorhizobium sp. AR10]UVK40247.1 hypothetical protein LHFGNBLO_001694 [Mesorhizobium sp. AR10]